MLELERVFVFKDSTGIDSYGRMYEYAGVITISHRQYYGMVDTCYAII